MKIFSVWELTRYVKNLLLKDERLQSLWVKGEISDFRQPSSGHLYFNLKDRDSSLRCVMFRGKNRFLKFTPREGQEVIVRGSLSLYEKAGVYQVYVEEMLPGGPGDLNQAFERLKEKLAEEGLFDNRHKKRIPFLPQRVALITSPTGAALRDIITTARRRSPGTRLLVIPVSVQGAGAAAEISEALKRVNRLKICDVIILARGGGSLEELWSFNEEAVARSIFQSEIPVVSAIGHETDYTLADFTADLRAATPTAAAELAVPCREDLLERVQHLKERLKAIMKRDVAQEKRYLEKLASSRALLVPAELTARLHQSLDHLGEKLSQAMDRRLSARREGLALAGARLQGVSPLQILARGYTLVEDSRGNLVTRAAALEVNNLIRVRFQDGSAGCQVNDVKGDEGIVGKEQGNPRDGDL